MTAAVVTFESLNQLRLQRAQELLTEDQYLGLKSLVALWHYNHQSLPGFVAGCVHGFDDFCWQHKQVNFSNQVLNFNLNQPIRSDFVGLYAMGSLATLGFGDSSDIDIWLVHSNILSDVQKQHLKSKAKLIQDWYASNFNLEINTYFVHPDKFIEIQSTIVEKDNSGSVERWLLLDEFYRTNICLIGPLISPIADESGLTLHFGAVTNIDATEFFSASLWQLYKAIDCPYKAVLKVLLLEMYADQYPHVDFISEQLCTTCDSSNLETDPYWMLFEKVSEYLLKIGDKFRLEVLRLAFYLKSEIRLSDPRGSDWRYTMMLSLVEEWHWSMEKLELLDDREHWHVGQLLQVNYQLESCLLSSYQKLLDFGREFGLAQSLKSPDLTMLSRKIHSYFNHEQGSIEKLHSLWAEDFWEKSIHLYQLNGAYHINFCADQARSFYQSEHLEDIIFWSIINKVARKKTKWFGVTHDMRQWRRMLANVARSVKVPSVEITEFLKPLKWKKFIVLLNVSDDPSQEWKDNFHWLELTTANPLTLSITGKSLVGSVSILGYNNWGEWYSEHIDSDTAILDALERLSLLSHSGEIPEIDVISAAKKGANIVAMACQNLLIQHLQWQRKLLNKQQKLNPVVLAEQDYLLVVTKDKVTYSNLQNPESSLDALLKVDAQFDQDDDLDIIEIARRNSSLGVKQYFFYRQQNVEVYLYDKNNNLEHFSVEPEMLNSLVESINCFHLFEQQHPEHQAFNLPQFYWIEQVKGQFSIVAFDC
ncbi:class I adenylate cyclase [Paraferrimonas sp. SM1919]|uniref:class I adenylate cyclase n=1 Tax=Paraferrimonas sp. SM1919 TaxID=2662263 RepID=UPI0013D6A920|nr:class I adenylate cyclase [Paraferrimonas sp. SM1919]